MTFKLRCILDCRLEEMTVKRGDTIRAIIGPGEDGIRFLQPDGVYTFPYYLDEMEGYFVSEFDDEEYERRNKRVQKITAYSATSGDELFEIKNAIIFS